VTTHRPSPDSTFEAGVANKYDIALRSADAVARTLAVEVNRVTQSLSVDSTELIGTLTVDGGDSADESVVAKGLDLRTSFSLHRHRDLSIYLISGRHYRGADLRGRHERLLVQRGGLSVCEVLVSMSARRVLAGHDTDELDTAHIRMTSGIETALGVRLSAILELLRVPPPVVLNPDADVNDVDLGGGRTVQLANDAAAIEWTLQPTRALDVRGLLDTYIAQCFVDFELGPVPELDTTTTRTWNCSRDETRRRRPVRFLTSPAALAAARTTACTSPCRRCGRTGMPTTSTMCRSRWTCARRMIGRESWRRVEPGPTAVRVFVSRGPHPAQRSKRCGARSSREVRALHEALEAAFASSLR
jgi:hypothetical protein